MKFFELVALLGLLSVVVASVVVFGGYGLILSAVVVAGFLSWCSDPDSLTDSRNG